MYNRQHFYSPQNFLNGRDGSFAERSSTASPRSPSYKNSPYNGGQADESVSSIMKSVKEEEAQFDRLTKELEAERKIVADQLEQFKRSSYAGSVHSIHSLGVSPMYKVPPASHMPGQSEDEEGTGSSLAGRSDWIPTENGRPYMTQTQSKNSVPSDAYWDKSSVSTYSSPGSYGQPENSAMTRSQASYSLNNAAESGTILEPHTREKTVSYADYQDYRELHPYRSTVSPISEGDYIDADAASSYLNNYRAQHHNSSNKDTLSNGYSDNFSEATNGQNGYRQLATNKNTKDLTLLNSKTHLNRSQEYLNDDVKVLGSNRKLSSTDQLSAAKNTKGSKDNLTASNISRTGSRDNLAVSKEKLRGSSDQIAQNPSYMDSGFLYSPHNEQTRREQQDVGNADPYTSNNYNGNMRSSQQSINGRQEGSSKLRPPDLSEVIQYLSHPNDSIKVNAAAYLQHLTFGNNEIKDRTRNLRGIPALVNLLNSQAPELHRNALGALLNLSRGFENDDNKRAIRNCGGIEALAVLLGKSEDSDVRELVTGILWNLSSLGELKKSVMEVALPHLVKHVITPASGINSRNGTTSAVTWSAEFRNATGVLRNISSSGVEARTCLRQCDGLTESLIYVARSVVGTLEMDNKHIENIICTLRNLSFRLMEVDYPDFYAKLAKEHNNLMDKRPTVIGSFLPGCFGKAHEPIKTTMEYPCRSSNGSRRGEQLWQVDLIDVYLPLLAECSNTDTLEAAVGAVQNLAACDWQPSAQFREQFRKKKGLPIIVELLGLEEADNVVCAAAIALRNLAVDKSNKALIGKYAIPQLVSKLPSVTNNTIEQRKASEETIRAVIATLNEIFREKDADSIDHAGSLVNDTDGLDRLVSIAKSNKKYTSKTLKGTHYLLLVLWRYTSLRDLYKHKGYKESDFVYKSMMPKAEYNAGTLSMGSTLTRPRSVEPLNNINSLARNNAAFREDHTDERTGNESYHYQAQTLPIQRDLTQPNETFLEQTNSRHQTGFQNGEGLAYTSGYYQGQQPPVNSSHPGLVVNTDSYRENSYRQTPDFSRSTGHPGFPDLLHHSREQLMGSWKYQQEQPSKEPLYARVDKLKQNDGTRHLFYNPGYDLTNSFSMENVQQVNDLSKSFNKGLSGNPDIDSWV